MRRASHRILRAALIAGAMTAGAQAVGASAGVARAADYVPGTVVVGYTTTSSPAVRIDVARRLGIRQAAGAGRSAPAGIELIRVKRGISVAAAIAQLRSEPGVAYAVPDYIAHIAGASASASVPADAADPFAATAATAAAAGTTGTTDTLGTTDTSGTTGTSGTSGTTGTTGTTGTSGTTGAMGATGTTGPIATPPDPGAPPPFYPNDPGRDHRARGWEKLQWNFLAGDGVDAPQAWGNLIADHRPGGKGVVVAVLDTGVAYTNWKKFKESPDFVGTRFVDPYDFVAHDRFPLDREGHGTFVAGTIAEATNNGIGVTGLAYGASIMPVRVLNADGNGDATTIAKGIRYAVRHGAQVLNFSFEFGLGIGAGQIPEILSALRYARRHNVIVVAAAGNDSGTQLAYPARASDVISVGATTRDACLADYSNTGAQLDLVAPGGGDDMALPNEPSCNPDKNLPDIFQTTFFSSSRPGDFGLPRGWYGTSMAAPHVSATAALVIASRVIGPHPTPEQVRIRLEETATPLGSGRPNTDYGYGLVNAAAATSRRKPPYSTPGA